MEHDSKLAFLQNMTHLALDHMAKVPNAPTPQGCMSHDKMLDFVNKVAKTGIQHLASGGTTAGGLGGAISGAIGSQNNFQASAAPIVSGVNTQDLVNSGTNANTALQQQANIAAPLQSGLNQGANQQQNLGQQLTIQSQGGGPNPAQAELNQNTGQNIAQQAALAAGQRGAGANAGLIATENAQQGAATQQQAVGQEATLAAQQQLAAQNNLQNLSASEVSQGQGAVQGLNNSAQNEQNILQGANTSYNNALVSQQSNLNNVNAGVAQGNASTAGNIIGGIGSGVSSAAGFVGSLFAQGGMVKMDKGGKVLDANARAHIAAHNFALPGGRYPIHDINHARNALARVAQNGSTEEKAKVKAAVHKKYPSIDKSGGGMIKAPQMMADGGLTSSLTSAPGSFVGNWLNSSVNTQGPQAVAAVPLDTKGVDPFGGINAPTIKKKEDPEIPDSGIASGYTEGSTVAPGTGPLAVSQGSTGGGYIPGSNVDPGTGPLAEVDPQVSFGGYAKGGGVNYKKGGKVPGQAKVDHDSLSNDTVPAMLSPGELVIDKDTMNDPGQMGQMARALKQHLSKKNKGKS